MMISARARPDENETTTVHDDVWEPDDRTLLYDPKFWFPPETLLALARAHARRFPDLVHRRERRRHMDSEAIAYVFGLGGVSNSATMTAKSTAGTTNSKADEYCFELDEEPAAAYDYYDDAVVEQEEEPDDYDYVLVGTAEELERERRREAAFEDAWNHQVRSIEQLLEETDDEEEDARAATTARNDDDDEFFDGFVLLEKEDEDAIEVGWTNVVVHEESEEELIFVNIDDDDDEEADDVVPEWA